MKTIIAVVTCTRPRNASFIEQGIPSFNVDGAPPPCDKRWIFVDGVVRAPVSFAGWETHYERGAPEILTQPRHVSQDEITRAIAAAGGGAAMAGANGWTIQKHKERVLAALNVQHAPETEQQIADSQKGIRSMMWRVFRAAVEEGCDRLIFCEDDVVACRNLVPFLQRFSVPERVAFVDFHDLREERVQGISENGHYVLPTTPNYWGNQCMLFPRRTVEWLAQQDPLSIKDYHFPKSGADNTLGHFLRESPWPFYLLHLPRLVQHIGTVSAAHKRNQAWGVFRAASPNFDALTLPHG